MSEFSSVYYVVHPSKGLIPFYGDFASKKDILDAIGQLGGTFKPLVVSSLPDAGEDGFIYFVPNGVDAGDNQHNEYLYFNGRWELIGSTGIDLTGFATEEALNTHTSNSSIHVTATDRNRWDSKQDAGDYATNTDLTTGLASKQDAGDYATNTALTTGLAKKQDVGDYATNTALKEGLATKQDVGDYATNSDLTSGLATKVNTAEFSTHTNNGDIHVTLDDKSVWNSAPTNLKLHTGDSDIHVTAKDKAKWNAKQDAGDYATNTALTEGLATKQDVGDYATNTALTEGLATKQAVGDYATNTALTEGLATKQDVGDYATNEALATGLATKQDAGDYATTDELTTHTGNTVIHVTQEDRDRWDAGSNEGVEASIAEVSANLTTHTGNSDIHVTAEDKEKWNSLPTQLDVTNSVNDAKASLQSDLLTHTGNAAIHVTTEDKAIWNAKQDAGDYATNDALTAGLATKQDAGSYATTDELASHTSDTEIHVTAEDKARWDAGSNEGVEASISEVKDSLGTHVGDTSIHVTTDEKDAWNAKQGAISTVNVSKSDDASSIADGALNVNLPTDWFTQAEIDTSDFVTLSGDQTITGNKFLKGGVAAYSAVMFVNSTSSGDETIGSIYPSSTSYPFVFLKPAYFSGTQNVFKNNVIVGGQVTAGAASIGNLATTGYAKIGTDLTVDGHATINGLVTTINSQDLYLDGHIHLSSSGGKFIDGHSLFRGRAEFSGSVDIVSDTKVNVDSSSILTVAKMQTDTAKFTSDEISNQVTTKKYVDSKIDYEVNTPRQFVISRAESWSSVAGWYSQGEGFLSIPGIDTIDCSLYSCSSWDEASFSFTTQGNSSMLSLTIPVGTNSSGSTNNGTVTSGNYVTLDTDQNISGNKFFDGHVTFQGPFVVFDVDDISFSGSVSVRDLEVRGSSNFYSQANFSGDVNIQSTGSLKNSGSTYLNGYNKVNGWTYLNSYNSVNGWTDFYSAASFHNVALFGSDGHIQVDSRWVGISSPNVDFYTVSDGHAQKITLGNNSILTVAQVQTDSSKFSSDELRNQVVPKWYVDQLIDGHFDGHTSTSGRYVDLTSNQEIDGRKTFNNITYFKSDISVDGHIWLQDMFWANNDAWFYSNVYFQGVPTFYSDVNLTTTSKLTSNGVAKFNGVATFSSSASFKGVTSFADSVYFNGGSSGAKTMFNTSVTFSGTSLYIGTDETSIGGSVKFIAGDVAFNNQSVGFNTPVTFDKLHSTTFNGSTSFNKDVSFNGDLSFGGETTTFASSLSKFTGSLASFQSDALFASQVDMNSTVNNRGKVNVYGGMYIGREEDWSALDIAQEQKPEVTQFRPSLRSVNGQLIEFPRLGCADGTQESWFVDNTTRVTTVFPWWPTSGYESDSFSDENLEYSNYQNNLYLCNAGMVKYLVKSALELMGYDVSVLKPEYFTKAVDEYYNKYGEY
jgi:hypothetical protein